MAKTQIIQKVLLFTLWTAIGAGTVFLLVAAIQQKDAKKCTDVNISIRGVSNNFFVDKNDILNTIISLSGRMPQGKPIGSFDLKAMEAALQKNVWVNSAQLFFDNNEKLQVNVFEREPVGRVFTTKGTTFYIDSSITMLPLSEKFSARLPVFTNFPSDKKVLLKTDSNLLREILAISTAIQEDSFYMAMIDQVDITPQGSFEMIPKFGNTIIVFGDAKDASEKLGKLQLFYKEVIVKSGWNKYSEINIQYKNQVVAKRKGVAEVKADSIRTLQLMKIIAENAERLSCDSLQTIIQDNEYNTTSNSIIQRSIERDDYNPSANSTEDTGPQGSFTKEKPITPGQVNDPVSKNISAIANKLAAGIKKQPAGLPADINEKQANKTKPAGTKEPKLLMPKPTVHNPQKGNKAGE